MVTNGDVITLNKQEVLALVDKECRKRLHISGKEFIRKRAKGELPNSLAVHDVEMMLRLAK